MINESVMKSEESEKSENVKYNNKRKCQANNGVARKWRNQMKI